MVVKIGKGGGFHCANNMRGNYNDAWRGKDNANRVGFVQTTTKAIEFYNAKVKDLEANIQDLEKIVHTKSGNLRAIEDGT